MSDEPHTHACSGKVERLGSLVKFEQPYETPANCRVERHPTGTPRHKACPQHLVNVVDRAARLRPDEMVRALPIDSEYERNE
ncbi:hypothetical protein [Streptomyces acidiscabies]|uniref:Uncharacterized protein n=1 Tax=Streptomyces acidiscabies TaxID=42234 RepID=A0ABU4LWM0_9ACTN|nr:hypothetical protein [Streptomyces acidiscabies]MDX3020110.1 hypothetical protein [Streptomyces acidiscabies]